MAAPLGNEFWKLRSKHGRDKLFTTPSLMLEAAYEYFTWCQKNPLYRAEPIKAGKKAGKMIDVPVGRPFTLQGLCNYLGTHATYFNEFVESISDKDDEVSKDFSQVTLEIKNIIYQQKFEGATVGLFNANIISRDLGLIDRTDHTTDGESMNAFAQLLKESSVPEEPTTEN